MKLQNYWNRIKNFVKKKYVKYAFVSSLLLIIISYFVNNSPLFTGESMMQYFVIQNVCEKLGIHKTVDYGNAVYYNVSYDKMEIPAIGKKNDTLGVNVITDRKLLLRFLSLLEKSKQYKYVILDVVFDKNDHTIYDDSLFNQIHNMRDIVIANDTKIVCADPSLISSGKAGWVNFYTTNVTTNFARYEYMTHDINSLPLVIYENIHPEKHMKRYGWGRLSLYTIGGRLCQNSCFLTFDNSFYEIDTGSMKEKIISVEKFNNLGVIINDTIYSEEELTDLIAKNTADKFVVIGDFIGDIHDTYMGPLPGTVLLMRALATLEEGGNLVYLLHVFLWFVIFFVINLVILNNKPISKYIPIVRYIKCKWLHFTLSIITYGVILIVCSMLEYICGYPIYSLVIPILYFSLLKIYVQYQKLPDYE